MKKRSGEIPVSESFFKRYVKVLAACLSIIIGFWGVVFAIGIYPRMGTAETCEARFTKGLIPLK